MTEVAPRGVTQLVRDRTFGPYFLGKLASQSGMWIHNIVAAILVYEVTGSATFVGLVSAAQFGGTLVLSPWAGVVGDRVDRRRLLLTTNVSAAVVLTGLVIWSGTVGVAGLGGVFAIVGASFLLGIGSALSGPALQALVPALVPDEDLGPAIALSSVTASVARAVGPLAGTSLLLVHGATAAFSVTAVSYGLYAVILYQLRPLRTQERSNARIGMRQGLEYVRGSPGLVFQLAAIAVLGYLSDPVITLAPPMAAQLGGGETLVGSITSAFGIAAVVTVLAVGFLQQRMEPQALTVLGLALLAGGMAVFATGTIPATALAGVAVAGAGFLLANTALTTSIQLGVLDSFRGRVMALWGMAFLGSRPLAAMLNGGLSDATSPRTPIAAASVVAAALALAVAARSRKR